ncbi:MAG: hypothetical protein B7Y88_14780 [Sphingomonadales bacterium 32-64-17]|nr:MAG: hypothetical protein B7Y88_14780 [Sphingomonadales bacterium 32-64-17]
MSRQHSADPDGQLALYRQAVDALGGKRRHAELLNMSERHGGRLYSGAAPVSPGILEDTARMLIAHAKHCQELERKLSPAFSANLTDHQRREETRGRPRGSGEN